jgi:glycosyltransferase involved in cell wall biosynthesis
MSERRGLSAVRPRVLLEQTPLAGGAGSRGLGRYVVALSAALHEHADVETFSLRQRENRLSEAAALPARARMLRRPHDVFVAPTPYCSPARAPGRWISCVLDAIPLDVQTYRRTGAKARLFYALARRANVILTLSEHARSRIVELLDVTPERIVVAPLPVAPEIALGASCTRPDRAPAGQYVVAMVDVVTPDARKRAEWLSGVADLLSPRGVPLLVAGAGSSRLSKPGLVGLDRVSDAEWRQLLQHAAAFVYTSAYEGQGMPPLEAMAVGAPVVAMGNTAVAEVVGDAGILVEETRPPGVAASGPHLPDDPEVGLLADALLTVAADVQLQHRMGAAGRARAGLYSHERFSQNVNEALQLAVRR